MAGDLADWLGGHLVVMWVDLMEVTLVDQWELYLVDWMVALLAQHLAVYLAAMKDKTKAGRWAGMIIDSMAEGWVAWKAAKTVVHLDLILAGPKVESWVEQWAAWMVDLKEKYLVEMMAEHSAGRLAAPKVALTADRWAWTKVERRAVNWVDW